MIIATIDPSIGINGYCDRTLDQDEFLSVVEKLFQAADRITMARSTRRNSEARLAALSFGCSPFDTDEGEYSEDHEANENGGFSAHGLF